MPCTMHSRSPSAPSPVRRGAPGRARARERRGASILAHGKDFEHLSAEQALNILRGPAGRPIGVCYGDACCPNTLLGWTAVGWLTST